MPNFIPIRKAAKLLAIPEEELAVLVLRPSGGPTRVTKGQLFVDMDLIPDFLDDLGVAYADPRQPNPDDFEDQAEEEEEEDDGEE